MKHFTAFIIIFWCLIQIMIFISTGAAQESGSPADTTEHGRASLAFDMSMLRETEMKDIRSALDIWMKMIGDKTGFRIESSIYQELGSLVQDYRKGILDVLNLSPLIYLQLEKKLVNVEPYYVPEIGGKKTRKYLLIVRSDSEYTGIQDLKGRKMAIMRINEVVDLYLNVLLLRKKLGKAEKFFSEIIEKTKYTQAVLAVFFGQADACISHDVIFKTMIELNPQIGSRLKIIASSPELINLVAFVRADYDKKLKERGLREIINLQESAEGRQGLMLFGVERFVPLINSDLDTMRALFNEYNELSKKR